jgi:FKBP-type peptidyl-prolyl cis-trans isomerase
MSISKFFYILFISAVFLSCKKEEELSGTEEEQITGYIKSKNLLVTETTTSGLRYIRTKDGAGMPVKKGQSINLNYTGKLLTDKKFDSGNFSFVLGAGRVVKGFDEGIAKMKVGEKATLIFPSKLGYGSNGAGGDIPPNSPLLFDVEVVSSK